MLYDITDTSTGEKLYTKYGISDIIFGTSKNDNRIIVLLPDGKKLIFEPSDRYIIAAHIEEVESPQVEPTLDELRALKKLEISDACTATISAGIVVNGKNYSLKEDDKYHDQIEISAQAKKIENGAKSVLYHADGELCRLYSAEEFIPIAKMADYWITYNRTKCNHMNAWIARAEGEELESITYGSDLPDDLQKRMDKLLTEMGYDND